MHIWKKHKTGTNDIIQSEGQKHRGVYRVGTQQKRGRHIIYRNKMESSPQGKN